MVGIEWLTVTAAARRLGITRTAVYSRIKRGTLQTQTDNHGHQLVNVDTNVTRDTLRKVTRDTVTPTLNPEPSTEPPHPRQDVSEMIPASVLRDTVEAIQQAHGAALAALEQRLLQQDANHLAEVDRLVGQVHAERAFWIERADAAEVRAEAAEQRLADSRRPWWSRLFGTSRRSSIRES